MLIRGPSCGHDFDFHLLSWLEVAQQFAHGSFPHWAYTPAFNAGEPRFIFYPPLSWSLGAILGLILPWTFVSAAFIWIALTLSGLTFHALARRYTTPAAATLGAVLYLANPYMLFTAYERSAFAELLAAAWLPLLFAAVLPPRFFGKAGDPRFDGLNADPGFSPARTTNLPTHILQIALPVSLLWLTNAPAAVMSTYALAFLVLVRLLRPGSLPRLRLAFTTAAGTVLGFAAAAFYIVPAAYERRFVQIQLAVIEGMRVSDHFLFHRMPGPTPDDRFHDLVVRTASLVALTLLTAIAAALLTLALRSFRPERGTASLFLAECRNLRFFRYSSPGNLLPLTLLTLAIAFLLTPLSLTIWTHVPELAFLQFPWRLTALLGLIFAFTVTLALPPKLTALPAIAVAAAVLIAPAWSLFHQHCDPEDTVQARVNLFHSPLGTDATDEYTPVHADPDALYPQDPPYWLVPAPASSLQAEQALNSPAPASSSPGPAPHHLTLTLLTPEYLVLNLRQYPAWQIRLNHALIEPGNPERDDGLIALLLPPGTDTVDLELIRTPDESLGLGISALAVLIVLALRFRPPGSAPAPSPAGTSSAGSA